ncbi:uncharacterized protein LOC120353408 [Nilaparvata lugens]|uniref:uncharacterized protein LOC120353408 n=1 Tax=Nilaparvata lugens TaxID=108931 RepID=UPI00193EB3F1|nr:uncharacterized protein LOC120353408 [Nilaparvata lugens]
MANADYLAHCRPIFVSLEVMTVFSLYVMRLLVRVRDELDVLECRSEIHGHFTRQACHLNVPFVRLKKLQGHYRISSIKAFNKLPVSVRYMNQARFKTQVKKLLTENPLHNVEEFFNLPVDVVNTYFV